MRNRLTDELAVCGLHAVTAIAEYNPEKINRLFLREELIGTFSALCKDLAERKRPYKFCEDEELEKICKSSHHQGIVAMIYLPEPEPITREELDAWESEASTGLLLHSVGNDHNLGAIIRAAAFFEVKYIILTEDENEAGISTSTYRVAEGGMEHVKIYTVQNSIGFLKSASRSLLTIGTDIRARRKVGDLSRIMEDRQKSKRLDKGQTKRPGILLVLGNEENGLPQEIKDACSVLIRIPGTGLMESLNVSQAAALFMHRIYEM